MQIVTPPLGGVISHITVEDLTLELITTKELLESVQAAHLEAEEQRITIAMAWEQDNLSWERELKEPVAKERNAAMVAELKSVKDELEALKGEHATLANEKDVAIGKAEESISISKTLELITTKELLESAQAAHLEAEEQRITIALAWEQDNLSWERELKQAEGEPQHLNELLLLVNDLKTKQDAACTLQFNLKVELAAYKEA